MKSAFAKRSYKRPHNLERGEKKEPFFGKTSNNTPFFTNQGQTVQPKLKVGKPGDKYEREADQVADAVVNRQNTPNVAGNQMNGIQRESLATPQEDEKLGTAEQRMERDKLIQEKPEIQRMEKPEEEPIQKMEEEEPVQMMEEEEPIQKMEEEEPVQMMEEEEPIQKMEEEEPVQMMEEEEPIQKMEEEEETVQQKSDSSSAQHSTSDLSTKLKSKAGNGRKMSRRTQQEMESSFGTDLSNISIHTDRDAVEMNQGLGAQAFTHGNDIYFNSGKYNPETTEGKRLLAHELTHTIQQSGMVHKMIQKACYDEYEICVSNCQRYIPDNDKRRRALCYAQCAEELARCRRENPNEQYRRVPEPEGIPWWVYGLGILGAGALSLADGPLPFGEAAAASLLISLGIISSEDSKVVN